MDHGSPTPHIVRTVSILGVVALNRRSDRGASPVPYVYSTILLNLNKTYDQMHLDINMKRADEARTHAR